MDNRKVKCQFTVVTVYLLIQFFSVAAFSFTVVEKSIDEIQRAILEKKVTVVEIVQETLSRIKNYESSYDFKAFITLNEQALAEAEKLDAFFEKYGRLKGPLHGVTVAVKDNVNTDTMRTTIGALENNRPTKDAYVVNKIEESGGIVIGKANLHEYAFGYEGFSLIGGQVKNAYDLSRGPGGSSSGTATAVAMSFATIGIGTDTGGSIRVPSAVQGLFGFRPSARLISIDGIAPLASFQDTVGPICRSVSDCAKLLKVMAGFDVAGTAHSEQRSKFNINSTALNSTVNYNSMVGGSVNYPSHIKENGLKGKKIAVVKALFGDGDSEENKQVQKLAYEAINKMKKEGAQIVEVDLSELVKTVSEEYTSLSNYQFVKDLTDYLGGWPSDKDGHPRSFEEVLELNAFSESMRKYVIAKYENSIDLLKNPVYIKNTIERPDVVRKALNEALKGVDALLYPTITGVAGDLGGNPTSAGRANRLSAFSGFPALSFPIGLANLSGGRSLPVGLEILGAEFDEGTLIEIAHAFEKKFSLRTPSPLSLKKVKASSLSCSSIL